MPMDFNQYDGPRSSKRAKRRKTNIVLNSLIAIVVALILIVGFSIFFGGEDPNSKEPIVSSKSGQNSDKNPSKPDKPDSGSQNERSDKGKEAEEQEDEQSEESIIEKESDEPNVKKVMINKSWKPIGTEQTGGHQPSYNEGTPDWNEKLKAISYATGIPEDNMTLWWIEGGADRSKQAVATVAPKDQSVVYRVIIDWVDGEGWKPSEVRELIENDKK